MKSAICLVLVFVLVAGSIAATAQESNLEEYRRGYQDGLFEGKNDASVFSMFWGFITGGIHTLLSMIAPGREPPTRLMLVVEDESDHYLQGFRDGYRDGWNRQRILYSGIGAGIAYALLLVSTLLK